MRIIAGMAKGTRLKMVSGTHVRPTADRVKESLFSVLGPFFEGGWALDLFAGTGALGLEALSRGMERAIFVDQSRTSLETVRSNVKACKMEDRVELYCKDARAVLKMLKQRELRFQLIFLDPPYQKSLLLPVLKSIATSDLLSEDGTVVAEHASREHPPETVGSLRSYRQLTYGDTTITLYGT
ncbi:16S rRNA (guanine(966)-N(2))-methyltransferase RsmD [Thermoflavimicrobium dichotomicum]|uniref:16S rRNA (Guanine(966)-N(2))-methyltransferase RsmD n=2 Tax=Thermoflavimicrobium dichotomicum TaxID=46223 RepID=A0A1I3SSF8_9BACL|nr:16S rRNA (guanine(966)-N(2))-methyltransferase RsmD [Thermoflavimicrobium dichotomicum]